MLFLRLGLVLDTLASVLSFKYTKHGFNLGPLIIMHFPLLGVFFPQIFTWLVPTLWSGTSCLLITEAFSNCSISQELSISLELCLLLYFLLFLHNTNHHPKYSIECLFILLFYINLLSIKWTRIGTFVCFVHCIPSTYDRIWNKLGTHLVFTESWISMICLGINGISIYLLIVLFLIVHVNMQFLWIT